MNEKLYERLLERWLALWNRIGAVGDAKVAFEEVIRCYGEQHRRYHTLMHLDQCFREFDLVKHLLKDPDAVELTIWFHDIVYVTDVRSIAVENEQRSARKAWRFITHHVDWDAHKQSRIHNYILATQTHTNPPDSDCANFLDIDMSILGQPDLVFDAYEKGIRYEYKHVPWKKFAQIRKGFVAEWLEKANKNELFLTEFFNNKYNGQAKKNLERSLNKLSTASKKDARHRKRKQI